MKPDAAQRASLSALIGRDIDALRRMDAELVSLGDALNEPQPSFRDVAAAAYVLHNLYGAIENAFDQISRTFENHIVDSRQWHRELLTKMFLDIPGIRPAVMPRTVSVFLNDLRGFRHVFRHAYEFELDAAKVAGVADGWRKTGAAVISALEKFRNLLLTGSL
jgi:hypothetical protein